MTYDSPKYDDGTDDDFQIENYAVDALVNLGQSDAFSGYPLSDSDLAQLGSGLSELDAGTDANKPAAGTADRFYLATDTNILYYDNGSSWSALAGAGDSNNRLPSTVYRDTVDANSVTTGEINNNIKVESESDLSNLSAGQSAHIPPETTVNISSIVSLPSNIHLDIYGTLRQADGADVGGWLLQANEVSDVTVRLFGTFDGNYANQTNTTTQAFITNEFGGGNPENVQFIGPGTLTGFEGNEVLKFTNTSRRCVMGGFEVRDWRATALNDAFVSWANTPEHCVYRDLVFYGSTFPSFDGSGGTSAGDGDCISGSTDQDGLKIINNTFFDIPRRGIQGGAVIAGNRGLNVATPGGGGDFITTGANGASVYGNVGYGTFDASGDNGVVARNPGTFAFNYMEGFTNNGVLARNTNGHGMRIFGNVCVDNDQGTSSNSNIEYRVSDTIGKNLGAFNVSIARNHSPTYGVHVESNYTDSRVQFDSAIDEGAGYGTAAFQDDSPASTTVNEL